MLVVEIPIVAAAAARSDDGAAALAAVGIGMSLLVVVNTPALAIAPLVAGERSRRDPRQLWRHTVGVGLAGTAVLLALALPPGRAVVDALFGLDAAMAAAVSAFLLGLAPNSLAVALRRHQHGRLIHDRATGPIVPATLVRLGATAAIAWVGTTVLPGHGPLVAGGALSAGAFLEAAALARRPARLGGRTASWAGLAARHAHLSVARLLTMLPTVVTTIGIAHAVGAPAALVVWPVLIQLAALFTSPTTDWESVTATVAAGDRRTPRRLTAWLAGTVTILFAVTVFAGPADAFVRGLLAVPDGPADAGLRWLWVLLPLPALWVVRAYRRGLVMAAGAHRRLTYAAAAHVVTLVGGLALLVPAGAPGVPAAATALVAGVAVETAAAYLASRTASRASSATCSDRQVSTASRSTPSTRPMRASRS
jgi:hypothetical protein